MSNFSCAICSTAWIDEGFGGYRHDGCNHSEREAIMGHTGDTPKVWEMTQYLDGKQKKTAYCLVVAKLDYDILSDKVKSLQEGYEIEHEAYRLENEEKERVQAENAALQEQLKECSAAFDKQQEQLDRNAERIAALREQLAAAIDAARTK